MIRRYPARHRLDESRIVGRVIQRVAQLADGAVQRDIEINKRVLTPKLLTKIVTRHEVALPAQQYSKNLERLVREPHLHPSFSKLPRCCVQFEDAESKDARIPQRSVH